MSKLKLSTLCALVWGGAFYLAFDKLHLSEENNWLSGFLLMLGSSAVFCIFVLEGNKHNTNMARLVIVLLFCLTLFGPFKVNEARNSLLLKNSSTIIKGINLSLEDICNDRGFCQSECKVSFSVNYQIYSNYFPAKNCKNPLIIEYAKSRPDIFKLTN
ncbi:MAG: hypothetical protein GY928_02865 [Colwellia sp.]|nr:hypothetical protein [Colwellia sp.]